MTAAAGGARPTFVVVGGGLAAASAVATLREEGYTGRLVLIGGEPHLPYERPVLSKAYLTDSTKSQQDALAHPAELYDDRDVELWLGTPASAVDLDGHVVTVGDRAVRYDRLLLATGSSARRLPAADGSGAPVAYLRTIEDAARLRAGLRPGRRVLVIGAGWIGLEVAASARTLGCDVVVVEPLEQPLLRVLGPAVGGAFAALHREHGVDLRTSTGVEEIAAGANAVAVRLSGGAVVETDLLVVGIGAVPETELAEAAGLEVAAGVWADERLETTHPDVFVAGDIARAHHPTLATSIRVEHWDNAKAQGATAARNMLGAGQAYDRLPYFFSDQYDLGMEYVGHVGPEGHDDLVVRGDLTTRGAAFWIRDGRVVAAMHANDWDAATPLRSIVAAGAVDLAALRDASVPLEDVRP